MSLDILELQEEANRINENQNNRNDNDFLSKFVRMPEGAGHVTVRILPPARKGMFGRDKSPLFQSTRTHKVNNKNIHCPRVQQKVDGFNRWVGDCPICMYYSSLWKRAEKLPKDSPERKALEKKARDIKPNERYYYNAIVRSQFNPETNQVETNIGPKILSVGQKLHSKIVTGITGDEKMNEKPLGDVTDVTGRTGRDFKIIKKVVKGNDGDNYPGYDESKFLDPSPLSADKQEIEKWLNSLEDLCALRKLIAREEMEKQLKIHNGVMKDDGASSFDYTQFEAGGTDEAVSVQKATAPASQKKAPVSAPVVEETVAVTADEVPAQPQGEAMPEEDFIKDLLEASK